MDNEIKEILKEIECYKNEELCLIVLSQKENNALLNYITNLQQENKRLEENNKAMQEEMARVWEENERLKEWKEDLLNENIELENIRKEAIEYIEKHSNSLSVLDTISNSDLLNILQNGSDKE